MKLKPLVEYRLITELMGLENQCKELSFAELVPRFLKANHPWSKATYGMNKNILESHLKGKPLPSNLSSRAAHTRQVYKRKKPRIRRLIIFPIFLGTSTV